MVGMAEQGRGKRGRPKKAEGLSKSAIYAVLSTFMTKDQAARVAGYSGKSARAQHINTKPYAVEISEMRSRLQDLPGFASFLDTIADLVDIREKSKNDGDRQSRLAANKQIAKNMGYEAPLKMELEQRLHINVAAQIIHEVLRQGLTPAAVREELKRRKRAKEIACQVVGGAAVAGIEAEPRQGSMIGAGGVA